MPSNMTLSLLITASAGAAVAALQQVGKGLDGLKAKAGTAQAEHARLGAQIAQLRAASQPVAALVQRYQGLGQAISQAERAATRLGIAQQQASEHRTAAAGLWGDALMTVGLAHAMAAPLRQAIDFESAMADVRKVVDGSAAEIAGLGQSIIAMSRTLPLAQTDLAALAASGGQLGVVLRDLPAFVATTAKMAVAFDMAAEEAGDAMAKLANVYQIPIAQIGHLGDVINQLSNESPAKARDIVVALSRVGGVAKQFGLTADQAAALANAFVALGKAPEVAGTAINALLLKLATATKQNKGFQGALLDLGTTSKKVEQAVYKDPQKALLDFLGVLEKVDKTKRLGVLSDLFGLEYADDIAVLVGSLKTYKDSLAVLPRTQGSMDKEFGARAATTANQIQLLNNSLKELGIQLGSAVLPALNETIAAIRPVVLAFADWARENPGTAATLGKVGAALLAFKVATLAVRAAWHLTAGSIWGGLAAIRAIPAALAAARLGQFMSGAAVGGAASAATAGAGAASAAAGASRLGPLLLGPGVAPEIGTAVAGSLAGRILTVSLAGGSVVALATVINEGSKRGGGPSMFDTVEEGWLKFKAAIGNPQAQRDLATLEEQRRGDQSQAAIDARLAPVGRVRLDTPGERTRQALERQTPWSSEMVWDSTAAIPGGRRSRFQRSPWNPRLGAGDFFQGRTALPHFDLSPALSARPTPVPSAPNPNLPETFSVKLGPAVETIKSAGEEQREAGTLQRTAAQEFQSGATSITGAASNFMGSASSLAAAAASLHSIGGTIHIQVTGPAQVKSVAKSPGSPVDLSATETGGLSAGL